jgi:hypothetical protein
MKTPRSTVLATLLGLALAGVAAAQINMPAPGSPGSSPDSAVRVIATSDLMVDRYITRWLRTHYPDWHADPIDYQEIGTDRYAVVYITASNNAGRRVYFRVQSRLNDPMDDGAPFPF